MWQWLKRRFKVWMFVHGMSRASHQYARLSQQSERVTFLMQQFGRVWIDVRNQMEGL